MYIRVTGRSGEIKPRDHTTRESSPFWIHPTQAFTVVETGEGEFLKSNRVEWRLKQDSLYKYRNDGSHTVNANLNLPDLPAQQIYDQAINSVVWIHTGTSLGSGVLIDKARKLVVTNQHVTADTDNVGIVFPYRQNGHIQRKRDFYLQNNFDHLYNAGYITEAQVIEQNVRNDLAIIQLRHLPPTAREIKHDFSRNVEDSMKKDDTVHILGNPGIQLWNWDRGVFVSAWRDCLLSGEPA